MHFLEFLVHNQFELNMTHIYIIDIYTIRVKKMPDSNFKLNASCLEAALSFFFPLHFVHFRSLPLSPIADATVSLFPCSSLQPYRAPGVSVCVCVYECVFVCVLIDLAGGSIDCLIFSDRL